MNPTHEVNQRKPMAAFVVSLLAGLWMLVPSVAGCMGGHGWMRRGGMMDGMRHGGMGTWMWRHGYMHDSMTVGTWSWIGLALAVFVCIAATIVYARPQARTAWGVAIMVGSVAAAATGVGFLPAVMGVVGGMLAVTWRPNERA